MGNRLFRVVYWNSWKYDGVALIYAEDEVEAARIHAEQRSNSILSVTAMTGGFTPGGFVNGERTERIYLPPYQPEIPEK